MEPLPIKIIGAGRYLPERVVPSCEVEAMCGLEDGWIERKTGVRERRWVDIEKETPAYMGARAGWEAIHDAGIDAGDVDLILNASGSPGQAIPDGAHLIQRELGLGGSGIPCMSVHATCLSFVVALEVAAYHLMLGRKRNVLIVTSEISSQALDFSQPESAVLLGDGAAAVVVTRSAEGEPSAIRALRQESYGEGADLAALPGLGTVRHPNRPGNTKRDHYFRMDGLCLAAAVRARYPKFFEKLKAEQVTPREIKYVVPHQANAYALRALKRFGYRPEQVGKTLDRLGNCVAASIPLTLYEAIRERKILRGDTFLLLGVGAGLTLGGMILTF